jgi:Cu(I)/Ag(I) efflux system membrane protein CusA/SilA
MVGYVMLNSSGRDEGGLVEEADRILRETIEVEGALPPSERSIDIPDGYYFRWVGSYQNQIEARRRFSIIIPLCLALIFILMYMQFRTPAVPLIIFFAAVPLAVSGGLLLVGSWHHIGGLLEDLGVSASHLGDPVHLTVAVVVGFIALLGICVDDGILMATYITQLVRERKPKSREEVRAIVSTAGQRRIRPAVMTTVTTLVALIPVVLATGRGADLSRPMALPVFGGMILEFLTMLVVPVIYGWWLEARVVRAVRMQRQGAGQ